MTNRMTMIASILVSLAAIAVLIGALSVLLNSPAQAQGAGVAGMRQITVIGEGTTEGVPDTAQVRMGVETTADTTNEALDENNSQVAALTQTLIDAGVAETDIQTTDFNVYPQYNDQGNEISGYTVNNTVLVTIRNLDEAGTLLDQVVQVGANRLYGISFHVDEPQALFDQARAAALANARTRAEQLAQASGTTLGEVLVITENIGAPSPIIGGRGAAMTEEAASSVPIQEGAQTFRALLQVTFELR